MALCGEVGRGLSSAEVAFGGDASMLWPPARSGLCRPFLSGSSIPPGRGWEGS